MRRRTTTRLPQLEGQLFLTDAELDEAEELDEGDPEDLGPRYAALREKLPNLNVLGGCCGTDHRHVCAVRDAW